VQIGGDERVGSDHIGASGNVGFVDINNGVAMALVGQRAIRQFDAPGK
jgi:hypothetical protein